MKTNKAVDLAVDDAMYWNVGTVVDWAMDWTGYMDVYRAVDRAVFMAVYGPVLRAVNGAMGRDVAVGDDPLHLPLSNFLTEVKLRPL